MKSLNEVKLELSKINKESPDSPIFNFDKLQINYRKVNKIEQWQDKDLFETIARNYIVLHYQAIKQNEIWSQFDFPLDKYTTNEDWDTRDTDNWKKYQEIQNKFDKLENERHEYNDKISREWLT